MKFSPFSFRSVKDLHNFQYLDFKKSFSKYGGYEVYIISKEYKDFFFYPIEISLFNSLFFISVNTSFHQWKDIVEKFFNENNLSLFITEEKDQSLENWRNYWLKKKQQN